MLNKIPLFVTVDTEGDNLWGHPEIIKTENANGVNRFQIFCEKNNIKPIYLVNYEMAKDDVLVNTLRDKNMKNLCEVGTHIHAWNSPPIIPLTEDDNKYLPFLIEYPKNIIEEKIRFMTDYIENRFGVKPISHRAGRWAIDEFYMTQLADCGYKVDCSVTPRINWRCAKGSPEHKGGVDYSKASDKINKLNFANGSITEIPLSTKKNPLYNNWFMRSLLFLCPVSLRSSKVYNALNARKVMMLRPDVRREKQQLKLIKKLSIQNAGHIELIIHSSEFYKGTSPHCKTNQDLDYLYEIMQEMFDELNKFCESITFRDYINNTEEKNEE